MKGCILSRGQGDKSMNGYIERCGREQIHERLQCKVGGGGGGKFINGYIVR